MKRSPIQRSSREASQAELTPRQQAARDHVAAALLLLQSAQNDVGRALEALSPIMGMARHHVKGTDLYRRIKAFWYLLHAAPQKLGDRLQLDREPRARFDAKWVALAKLGQSGAASGSALEFEFRCAWQEYAHALAEVSRWKALGPLYAETDKRFRAAKDRLRELGFCPPCEAYLNCAEELAEAREADVARYGSDWNGEVGS